MKKIDKVIGIIYWVFVISYLFLLPIAIFLPKYDSLGLEALGILVVFFILLIIYHKIHQREIFKIQKNKFSRTLKYASLALFLLPVFTFVIMASVLNKALSPDWIYIYEKQFTSVFYGFLEIYRFLWPVIFVLFAIDYVKKKEPSLRSQNLKDLLWSLVFIGILTNFSRLFGTLIYDIELLLILYLR